MWTNLQSIVNAITDLALRVVPLLAVIAFLVFILGVGKYIRSTSSDADRAKNKNILIWGVVGLFVLFSIWGILTFLRGEFGFSGIGIPQLPTN